MIGVHAGAKLLLFFLFSPNATTHQGSYSSSFPVTRFLFFHPTQNGIWCNTSDQAGTIMSALVWCLLLYSAATVTALTITDGIPKIAGEIYTLLVCCSLACHAKTSLSDPGSIPMQAIPIEKQRLMRDSHSMCGQCQTFKPPASHHCRICNRCISKMDHHCPWMNNCVGVSNMKHFILFLIYTWTCASYSLLLFGWNYFFCNTEECIFHPVVVHLVRIMTFLAVGAFLFTSSMLMNVCYGIITGIGTIDRLKKKATNTMSQSDEEPIPLTDIFGIGPYYTWCLPTDPIFDEYDRVLGYTMPQRLDRERQLIDLVQHNNSNVNNSNDRIQSSPLSPLSSSPETELLSPV